MDPKQEWKIGDCLKLLPTIEDKSIDMILTDLPYGTTACKWDIIIPFEPLWDQYKRIIKDTGAIVLTAAQPFTSALIMSNIDMFKYCWVWQKDKPTNHLNANIMPMRRNEDITVFYKNQCTYNAQLTHKNKKDIRPPTTKRLQAQNYGSMTAESERSIPVYMKYPNETLKFRGCSGDKGQSLHPTQKPVALFEYLIKTYTNEGDTVHDSCLGSGTTLEACMNTKRNCIGFEISDEWVPHYKKRLRSNNSKLTDVWNRQS